MRYLKMKRVIVVVVLLTVVGVAGFGHTDNFPSQGDVASARKTSDLLHNELFAALIQEFNETTTANVEEGKQAISLIFNNSNKDLRLVGIFRRSRVGSTTFPATRSRGRRWPSRSRASRTRPSSAWAIAGTIGARIP